ncbi:MAG: sensor histidine kinase [Pedobacter sp.]|nr:MAG: sensor histidine kinase [Pedobacter sp.]
MTKLCKLYCLCLFIFSATLNVHAQVAEPDQHNKQVIVRAKQAYKQGNYPLSLKGALSAYHAAEKDKDLPAIADAGNLIGLVYLTKTQPKIALTYFRTSASINRKIDHQSRLAANLINIGLAQSDLHQLDSAIYFVKESLKISKIKNVEDLVAMGTNHLGNFYFKSQLIKESEQAFLSVLNNTTYQSDWENSFASTGMARIRYSQNNYREAGIFADQAFKYATKAGANWDAAQSLELAHKAYHASGELEKAYARLLKYKTFSDSLVSSNRDIQINRLLLKEKLSENANLKNVVKISSQQRKIDRLIIAITGAIALLLVISAITIYLYNRKTVKSNRILKRLNEITKKQNEIFERQNEDLNDLNRHKDRLLSIIGHDLRSPFAVLETTLALFKSGDLDKDEFELLVDQLGDQIHPASNLLDSLLVWAGNQLNGSSVKRVPIDLAQKVNKVISVLELSAGQKNVKVTHDTANSSTVWGDADQVRIMIQNLISNAIKFTGKDGTVNVIHVAEATYVDLIVQDNGVGMTSEVLNNILNGKGGHSSTYGTGNEKGIGLGLRLIKDFASQNNIELLAESTLGKGTSFILRFQNYQ